MNKLILQIIIRQWDKSEISERDNQARDALPDRYLVKIPPAKLLSLDDIIIDQHGDDLLNNRVRYQLLDTAFLIDRFRFDLETFAIEFKKQLKADIAPIKLATLGTNWQQFQYKWRYRVKTGGYFYWLYENVTMNVAFKDEFAETVFMASSPERTFTNLINQVR